MKITVFFDRKEFLANDGYAVADCANLQHSSSDEVAFVIGSLEEAGFVPNLKPKRIQMLCIRSMNEDQANDLLRILPPGCFLTVGIKGELQEPNRYTLSVSVPAVEIAQFILERCQE